METGGSQTLLVDILNTIQADTDVSLIVVNNEVDPAMVGRLKKNIPVYYIRRRRGSRNPAPLIRLNLLLLKLKPDVIHCHETNMVNFFLPGRFKTLLTIHDVAINNIRENKYSRLVAISRAVAGDIASRYQLQVPVIMNGIPFSGFMRRRSYDYLSEGPFKIIQVSRLVHEKKGQHILIQALHLLVNEMGYRHITLDIVGCGPSEDYLQQLVKDYELQRVVQFCGNREREWLMKQLAGYHLLVQPSVYEGFGLTVVEAVAAGIPVVASDIDGPREILHQSAKHLLFEKENAASCAEVIRTVMQAYESGSVEGMIQQLYEQVTEAYSIDNTISSYKDTYAALAAD